MNIEESEVFKFLAEYEKATNTHVFSSVIDFIHPEAIYRFTDGDFVGIQAIQNAFEKNWNSIKNEKYRISNLKVITSDTCTATVTYTFEWSGLVDGVQKNGKGRGTNIVICNDNKLQFIHEHLSM
jgi:Tfp pilus assembly protein PilW